MSIELWLWAAWSVISTYAAIHFSISASMHRAQVCLLQAQRREDREAIETGRMAASIEGLWSDLDEEQRLRDRVKELESAEQERVFGCLTDQK